MLNITRGNEFKLSLTFSKDGQAFSFDAVDSVCFVNSYGRARMVAFKQQQEDGAVIVDAPADLKSTCYGIEVVGLKRSAKRRVMFAKIVNITETTEKGDSPLMLEADGYDISMRVELINDVIEPEAEAGKENVGYTGLQRKAAEWVSRQLENSSKEERESNIRLMNFLFDNEQIVHATGQIDINNFFEGVKESDDGFLDKLEMANAILRSIIFYKDASHLFTRMQAPNYDLHINILSQLALYSLFSGAIVKTITISHEAGPDIGDISSYANRDRELLPREYFLGVARDAQYFSGCAAEKVTIKIAPYDQGAGIDGGWFLLACIGESKVETFEVGYIRKVDERDKELCLPFDYVVDSILPDVSANDYRPNLIFTEINGEVTEETKQRILAKGYKSVEFVN